MDASILRIGLIRYVGDSEDKGEGNEELTKDVNRDKEMRREKKDG